MWHYVWASGAGMQESIYEPLPTAAGRRRRKDHLKQGIQASFHTHLSRSNTAQLRPYFLLPVLTDLKRSLLPITRHNRDILETHLFYVAVIHEKRLMYSNENKGKKELLYLTCLDR